MLSFANPTGGLFYHLRAARSASRWRAFRQELAAWLVEWNPPEPDLLLIGPSGGYTLERMFVDRFDRLQAIDPDPLARAIFKARFGGRRVAWSRRDYFGGARIEGLRELLQLHPGHAVLLCNFIGQMKFIPGVSEYAFSKWKAVFPEALAGRSFASYHDRLSGPIQPTHERWDAPGLVPDAEVLDQLYPAVRGELIDHLTGDLCPGLPRRFMRWEIVPGTHHLIEAFRST